MLFYNLKTVFGRLKIRPGYIWNMDKTGITDQKPDKVAACNCIKRRGRLVSTERETVTQTKLDI